MFIVPIKADGASWRLSDSGPFLDGDKHGLRMPKCGTYPLCSGSCSLFGPIQPFLDGSEHSLVLLSDYLRDLGVTGAKVLDHLPCLWDKGILGLSCVRVHLTL